jgi:hypothetical protein
MAKIDESLDTAHGAIAAALVHNLPDRRVTAHFSVLSGGMEYTVELAGIRLLT